MRRLEPRSLKYIALALMAVFLCTVVFVCVDLTSAEDTVPAQTPEPEAYLENPFEVGELINLVNMLIHSNRGAETRG